ncbi:MAG: hypothetical protein HZC54_19665 [Verrucomicrobia bacterium]|nr:hypothetical protein [Verrucomicrobiota bacterium]
MTGDWIRWTVALWLAGLCLIAGATAAEKPKPFLSLCVEQKVPPPENADVYVQRPATTRVESPFHDVPFAVHVPVEVPFDGGQARITLRVAVHWENPPAEWNDRERERGILNGRFGIYRLDGKPLVADSASFEIVVIAPKEITRGQEQRRPSLEKMVWFGEGPVPTMTFPLRTGGARVVIDHEPDGRHAPMPPDPNLRTRPFSFVLSPAQAGWHVFWFAMEEAWPRREPALENIKLRLHVDSVVSRGESYVSQPELDYLFGRGRKPKGMLDDSMFRASTTEIPVVLRRDGWVFDRAEVRVADPQIERRRSEINGSDYDIEQQANIAGRDVALRLKMTEWRGQPSEQTVTAEYDWKISLPERVPDNGFAAVTAGGGVRRQLNKQASLFRNREPGREPWEKYYFDFDLVPLSRLFNPALKREEETAKFTFLAAKTGDKLDADGANNDRKEFVRNYGDAARDWFPTDFRENRSNGPRANEPPFRYIFRGNMQETVVGERHRVATDAGPYPLLVLKAGPWHVFGHYRRLKDVEGRAVAGRPDPGNVTVVNERDPFWEWYPGYSRSVRAHKHKLDAIKAEAGLISQNLERWLRSSKILLSQLTDTENPPSDAITARLVQHQRELSGKIRSSRERLQALTTEGAAAGAQIVAEIDKVLARFGPRHPELLLWQREHREETEKLPLMLALASQDVQTMRKAAADAEAQGLTARARLLQAQVLRLTGDPVGALESLRSAANVEPDDSEIKETLKTAECAFLDNAIRKSHGAIRDARDAFYGYLMERGFAPFHVKPKDSRGWLSVLDDPRVQRATETAWAFFTTGVAGSLSAIYGKPAAQERLLDATQTRLTAAYLGLQTMLRLRDKGHSFAEIQRMNSDQLRSWLPMRDLFGKPFSDQQLHELGTAVRTALELPDVNALVRGDAIGLRIGLEKAYWNARDVGDTWIEWLGDATSMWNLINLLPLAKAGAVPNVIFWGHSELELTAAAQKAGTIISGTEFVGRSIGLESVLGKIGGTDAGKWWLAELQRSKDYQQTLGGAAQVGWTVGKAVAMMGTLTYGVHFVDQVGGHRAALALQFLLLFGGDFELMEKCLRAGKVPVAQAERVVTANVLPALARQSGEVQKVAASTTEVRAILDKLKRGKTIKPAESDILKAKLGKDWRKRTPTGQASHDANNAVAAAAESAEQGTDNGALQAAEALAQDVQEELGAVNAAAENARKVAENLKKAARANPPQPPAPQFVPQPPRRLSRIPFPVKRGAHEAGSYPLPPSPQPGSLCAKAEAALHEGNFARAQTLYEDAYTKVARGVAKEADEMPLEFIQLKINLAAEAKTARRAAPGGARPAFCERITETQAQTILAVRSKWTPWPKERMGAVGVIHDVPGYPEYLVKVVEPNDKIVNLVSDVENELVSNHLARALGFDVPGMAVHLDRDAAGNVVRACYFMRRIEGRPMHHLGAGEVFLYRKELSRHRALSLMTGDYDRKLDNYFVSHDGRLLPIDAGMADVRGSRARAYGLRPDEPYIMEGAAGRDHWYSRYYKDVYAHGPNAPYIELWSPSEMLARKNIVAEEALTFKAAKPMLDKIEKLMADKPGLRKLLKEAYEKIHPDPAEVAKAVQETVENLERRASRLDQVMQGLKQRNLAPLTWLLPRPRGNFQPLAPFAPRNELEFAFAA